MPASPPAAMDHNHYPRPPQSPAPRRLTLDEALQRTPLVSIAPFLHDTVSLPQAAPTTLVSTSLTESERSTAQQALSHYDKLHRTSTQLQHKLDHLRSLLSQPSIPPYQFPPHAALPQQPTPNGNPPSTPQTPRLTNFATALLNSTNVPWTANAHAPRDIFEPTTSSSSPRQVKKQLTNIPSPAPTAPPPPRASQPSPLNGKQPQLQPRPPDSHALTPTASQATPPPATLQTPNGSQSSQPMVVMTHSPHRNLHNYQSFPELDAQMMRMEQEKEAEKRNQMALNTQAALSQSRPDIQERASGAVRALEDMLSGIFAAEDQLAPDTSGNTPMQDHDVFTRALHGDEPFLLSSVTLVKLDSSISKVTNSKRLDAIHVEYLLRAQRLCHKVVLQCADADLTVPEDASEHAILGWLPNVEMMDSAMLAARVIIKIMTGRREKRELCSEEILADVLNVLRPVVESTIIPIVEMKATSEPGRTLKTTSQASAMLSSLVQRSGRVLRFLGELLRHVELSETAFTQVEDLCMKLIFVTNSSTEKESVLGIQKLETFRRLSMDVLATVFFRKPDQRKSIMSDMLSSLEKLPVARQSARQFKIEGRKPIQLVSALVMQLVQTTASLSQAKRRKAPQVNGHVHVHEEEESDADAEGEPDSEDSDVPHSSPTKMQGKTPVEQLATIGRDLLQSVSLNARYICNYLVTRALSSSKTSDEPYRNLLDIFTEDFINVLGAAEWPAAELLLQHLLREMLNIMNKKDFGAPAKNMALDIMGVMGSGIADLRQLLEKATQHVDDGDDVDMAQTLQFLAQAYFQGDDISQDLIALKGPYRAVIEMLDQRAEDDLQLQQARSYLLLQWAQLCWTLSARQSVESNDASSSSDHVATWLKASIESPRHISESSDDIGKVSTSCSRVASALVTVNMTFCRANQKIFQVLVQCMDSTHATVRSRALRSVYQFMEKDPSVLAGSSATLRHIFNLAQDSSPLVRESALNLIGKVIVLRPELESRCLPHIVTWTSDSSFGIRKRAVKLVKDVYEQTKEEVTRLSSAAALLQRLSDDDSSVKDLARQSLSDLWMEPYFKAVKSGSASVEEKLELQRHASRLIAIADQSEEALNAFEPLFSGFLREGSPNAAENRQVCKAVVTSLFETFIENEQQTGAKSRQSILAFFSICAQAGTNIFTYEQLALLQVYTHNHKTTQDLRLFQKVAKIYNATFPFLSSARHGFIEGIQYKISASVTKIPPESFGDLMDEATKCLWTISQILRNDQRLFSMWHQTVAALEQMKNINDPKLRPFIFMAGYFGKNWNMEPRKSEISKRFPKRQFGTVSNLLVQVLCPIVNPARPAEIQRDALNSLCLICLTNPSNFLDKQVVKLFGNVLQGGSEDLQRILLIGFRDFFVSEEAKGKFSADGEDLSGIENSAERLGKSMKSSEGDDALNQLGQMYSADVFRLARSPKQAISLAGVEIIASVNRQGLVVPRENVAVLICLETSPVARIAKIAFEEHRRLNTKHESIVEKVYVLAFGEAFKYQRDVFGDAQGFIDTSPKLKLFFTVLKESSIAARKTFLKNICKQLKPPAKEKTISELQQQYQFVKFVCENLGLAEFARVDEIMIVIDALETAFGTLGSPLSQEIEALNTAVASGQLPPTHDEHLHRLALHALTLSLLWHTRTCLRDSTTNLPLASKKQTTSAPAPGTAAGRAPKNQARDPTKPPNPSTNRIPVVRTFLAKANPPQDPLATPETRLDVLRTFMDLHSLDHDARIASDDDEDALDNDGAGTPSLDDVGSPAEPGSGFGLRGAKRKRSVSGSAASTPTKSKKRGRPSLGGRRKSSFAEGGEGEDDGDADFMG